MVGNVRSHRTYYGQLEKEKRKKKERGTDYPFFFPSLFSFPYSFPPFFQSSHSFRLVTPNRLLYLLVLERARRRLEGGRCGAWVGRSSSEMGEEGTGRRKEGKGERFSRLEGGRSVSHVMVLLLLCRSVPGPEGRGGASDRPRVYYLLYTVRQSSLPTQSLHTETTFPLADKPYHVEKRWS